jgi:hypothetical protein
MVSVTRILSPEEWKKRQLGNLKAVGETNYKQGINTPKKDPIEEGIKAEDKWAARIKAAIEKKSRAKALQATNMQEWFNYSLNIGAPRLVEGVTKREAKIDKFIRVWQPLLLDHVGKIDALPAVTDKDMEERMLQNLRGLKALHGAWRG